MRDPLSWAIPLFRAFGIQVKLHILYILFTIGMIGRIYYQAPSLLGEYILIWVVLLFVIILLHEFGHCFAARRMDGDADEILMGPLGGLAYCNVPQTARANFVTTAGGPMVNVVICLVAGGALFASGLLPPINIFQTKQLYNPEMRNWRTGETIYPPGADCPYYLNKKTNEVFHSYVATRADSAQQYALIGNDLIEISKPNLEAYPTWALWTARLFWLSWMLFLFNLLPAFPMDGGRLFQCALWARTGDYRSSTIIASYTGMAAALIFVILSIAFNDALLFALAAFIIVSCYRQLLSLEIEERGAFGYDFSKGYGGFGPEDEPAPKQKRPGFIKRWRLARKARREQREAEQRAEDEARLDALLDKIMRLGKDSLSAEEKRFMERVSSRYRNRP